MLARAHPYLTKIAALIHRDDAVGIIAQRILSGDTKTTDIVNALVTAMWMDPDVANEPSIGGAIDVYGWPIVREVAMAAMLHQIHVELAVEAHINPVDMDRFVLGVVTAGVHFEADPFATMLANVGIAGMAAIGGIRYTRIRSLVCTQGENLCFLERNEFGFDHGTLGAAMLREAEIPEAICQAVQGHVATGTPIWLAEELAGGIGLDGGLKRPYAKIGLEIFGRYNLSNEKVERIKESMIIAAGLPEYYFAAEQRSRVA